jgi:hypothetical protein
LWCSLAGKYALDGFHLKFPGTTGRIKLGKDHYVTTITEPGRWSQPGGEVFIRLLLNLGALCERHMQSSHSGKKAPGRYGLRGAIVECLEKTGHSIIKTDAAQAARSCMSTAGAAAAMLCSVR